MKTQISITINNTLIYQGFVKKAKDKFTESYHDVLDNLYQCLKDTESFDMAKFPDLSYYDFTFLNDWEDGKLSSKTVYNIIKNLDTSDVARSRVTRRLENVMLNIDDDEVIGLIKQAIAELKLSVVPLYESYLRMLMILFSKFSMIDDNEQSLTWLEQRFFTDSETKKAINDLTLTQTVRQLDTFVITTKAKSYFLGKNVIIFNEEQFYEGQQSVHWIFGSESHIEMIKKMYNVTDILNDRFDQQYLKNLISEYVPK